MSELRQIDQVLQTTTQLLNRLGASSVSDRQVLRELGWSADRAGEVRLLMAQLVEQGDLRGPLGGPLRGDNQIMDVDVLGVTGQGQQRLAQAMRPAPPALSSEHHRSSGSPLGGGEAPPQPRRHQPGAGVDLVSVVDGFHPRIRDASRRLVAEDHLPLAVHKAAIALRDLLREKSGLTLDGQDLAGAALSPRGPRIVIADLDTETGRSIQQGTMFLAQGVFAAMRNVVAHNAVEFAPEEALEMLATISLVARRIEAALLHDPANSR